MTAQDVASSRENREAEEVTAFHINMPDLCRYVSMYATGSVAIATRLGGQCGPAVLTAGVRSGDHLDKTFVRLQPQQDDVVSVET